MNITLQLNTFSGPLDLLLSLIDEKKLSITEIALSEVTEQYLHVLEEVDDRNADELADFLVIATRLLLLKSKTLLPSFLGEEEGGPSLEEQLRLYKIFVDASKRISNLWSTKHHGFFRIEPTRVPEEFVPPQNVTTQSLHFSIKALLLRLTPPKSLPKITLDRSISVKDKIDHIRQLLRQAKSCYFNDIIHDSTNRTDIILGFMAVLELIKQKQVVVRQQSTFGTITLEST